MQCKVISMVSPGRSREMKNSGTERETQSDLKVFSLKHFIMFCCFSHNIHELVQVTDHFLLWSQGQEMFHQIQACCHSLRLSGALVLFSGMGRSCHVKIERDKQTKIKRELLELITSLSCHVGLSLRCLLSKKNAHHCRAKSRPLSRHSSEFGSGSRHEPHLTWLLPHQQPEDTHC